MKRLARSVVIMAWVHGVAFLGGAPARPEGQTGEPANLIPNGDFSRGELGGLPDGWELHAYRPALAPRFRLVRRDGRKLLEIEGAGHDDCVGYVGCEVPVKLGQTYCFRVVFQVSEGLNPHEHLLFQCFGPGARDGISDLSKRDDGWIEGEAKIHYSGTGAATARARVLFRLSADGRSWIRSVSLTETTPVEPRWVTVACTQGRTDRDRCRAVLAAAGEAGVDLVLLPEYLAGGRVEETVPGPSSTLMAEMAKRYEMYVAGGIVRRVPELDRVYNTALLYDRQGGLVGTYDKIHPYSPEINEQGITPGTRVPVFRTDFGKVGFMICYDSWFTDVAELLSLKGARLILFPNAGYYRSLMPARAADNRVRIVCSTWNDRYGVWDTVGRDVLAPDADPSHRPLRGVTFRDVRQIEAGGIKVLIASLDMSCSPSPAHNGGTMYESPGGRRNRREQKLDLEDLIYKERRRWWIEGDEHQNYSN